MAGRPRVRTPRTSAAHSGQELKAPGAPASPPDSVSRETSNPQPEAHHEVAQPSQPDQRNPGPGRPTKFDPALLALAEKCGKAGLIDEQIAAIMGVAVSTYYLWLKEHPEFSEALKKGQTDKRARLRATMFQRAIGYRVTEHKKDTREGKVVSETTTERHVQPSDTMLIFLACNEMPEEYKHVQHIQAGGGIDVHLKDTVPAQFIMDMNKFMKAIGEKAPQNGNGHHPAPAPKRELAKAGNRYASRTSMDIQGDDDEDIPLPQRNKAEPEYEPEDTGDLDLSELEDD